LSFAGSSVVSAAAEEAHAAEIDASAVRVNRIRERYDRPNMRLIGAALVAAAAAVGIATASPYAQSSSRAGHPRPPAVKGDIVYPCIVDYPDGQFPELCALGFSDVDGGIVHELTNDKQAKTDPAWSSDGTSLAYVSNGRIYMHDVWKDAPHWASPIVKRGTAISTSCAPRTVNGGA
jgi:hypothetical protein